MALGLAEPDEQETQSWSGHLCPRSSSSTNNIIKGLREVVVSRSPEAGAFEAADDAAKSGVPEVNFVGEPVLGGSVLATGFDRALCGG